MKKEANIYFYPGRDKDYTMMTGGTVELDGDNIVIEYDEEGGGKMNISVFGGIVSLSRIGEMSYTIILEKDKPSDFSVKTQYGNFPASLKTENVRTFLSDNAVEIELNYTVTLAGNHTANNLYLKCDITESKN